MSMPEFINGQLMPSIYDDVFRYLASESYDYTGDVTTIGWYVTRFTIDRDDIRRAVSVTGNPRASEAGAVLPGDYLTLTNSDGIIWAFYYPGPDLGATMNCDFADAALMYERFESGE